MSDVDRRAFLSAAAGGLAAMALMPELGLARMPSRRAGLRLGVIGAGSHGREILGEIGKIDGADVVALCDVEERRLRSGLRRTAGAEGFAGVAEMLDRVKDLDAVVIATPPHTHREVFEACAQAGKHIYLETPIAASEEDCKAINDLARTTDAVVAAGFQARSNPVYKLARGFFLSDSVRDLVSMRAQRNKKTSWGTTSSRNWKLDPAVSPGLAGEWGSQQFDVMHWYTGRYPTAVRGKGDIRFWGDDGREIADTIAVDLLWGDDSVTQYSATLANSYEGMYEVFYGTNAAIKLSWSHGWLFKEADAPTQGWEVYANRVQFHNDEGITLIADATKLASQGKLQSGIGLPYSSLYYALGDFVASIEDGTTPSCTIDEGARGTLVGLAANRAVVSGEDVAIDMGVLS